MSRISTVLVVVLAACAIFAQSATPNVEPRSPKTTPVPTVTFTFDFPDASVSHYSIVVESSGRAAYQSIPTARDQQTGEPYMTKFEMTQPLRERIFQLTQQAKYFNANFDWKKSRVAFTGTKTLAFSDADRTFQTTYNWTVNPQVQQLTTIFQNISTTLEFGRRLDYLHSHDKLGLDAELKSMQDAAESHNLTEIQAVVPILQSIADDHSVINVSRKRAEELLAMAQPRQ